ncbi:hypothetical protein E2C01_086542 [Portunus trituberculatus]|uniref:Uncharacterized protein n=1 Tax=Portunus trituberculatus TaxID=210409 RepID=A0A5B7J5Q0_PORTR|nr:hypothetical protein [Portunus trituberculatus]
MVRSQLATCTALVKQGCSPALWNNIPLAAVQCCDVRVTRACFTGAIRAERVAKFT